MTKNSSLLKNMPMISIHSTNEGAWAEVIPTERPTVLRAEAYSKRDSFRPYPCAVSTTVPIAYARK